MSPRKHDIRLSDGEREMLRKLGRSKKNSARLLRRCQMLLLGEKGYTDKVIAEKVGCSINCVANLRKRCALEGLKRALYDAPRSGAPTKYSAEQLMAITRLAAGEPPVGTTVWTLELLSDEVVRLGIVDSISIGKLHQHLKLYDQPPRYSRKKSS